MRAIVVGLGVQGYKRRRFAGADSVASVDPANNEADYRDLAEVPLGIVAVERHVRRDRGNRLPH